MPNLTHLGALLDKRAKGDTYLPDGTPVHTTYVSPMKQKVYLWIGVVDIFIFVLSTCLFVYRGRRTFDINAHAVLLTSIGSFTILVVNTCFLFQFVWPGYFPCFVILWCAYPGVMLWMSCTMARALRLYILSFRNLQKLKERNKAGQMTAAQLYGKGTLRNSDSDLNMDGEGGAGRGKGGVNALNHGFGPRADQEEIKKVTVFTRMKAGLSRWWVRERVHLTERRLVWYTLGATLFSAIICAFIQGFTKDLGVNPMMYSKCPVGVWEYFPLYALIALYCIVLTPFIVYHVWPIKDAFGIRHDILLNNLFTFVCIIMFIVQTNNGFGGNDPFWDSFLWCALLFNMSQCTSVIYPLIRSYRHSDSFTWSDSSGRAASKDLFYRVLNHPELFEKLKIYSAANFCTEITLFLEEYQVLKANTIRFYNMGEAGFDDANDDDDIDMGGEEDIDLGNSQTRRWGDGMNPMSAVAYSGGMIEGENGRSSGSRMNNEKDPLRMHLNGNNNTGGGKHLDLESNPDTIISVGDAASMTDVLEYSDKAAMMKKDVVSGGAYLVDMQQSGFSANGNNVGMSTVMQSKTKSKATPRPGSSKLGRFFSALKGGGNEKRAISSMEHARSEIMAGGDPFRLGDSHPQTFDNTAALAVGGAAIGNLPQRRNSNGDDIMVVSRIPPFTPVRYTIISSLLQTPAGLTRQGNMNTFKTLPFALRGDYYGFYSTFIADGATLQINVEGRISEAITRLIHSQKYTVDMMDEAHSEVLQLLYDNIFKKFVRLYHRDMASIM
ncbi:hypothetical protein EV175_004710 [Coemansia sp. RSA 1933]|nr:hypothetical protein EV175_004710 [Coemansia sp. RSA 1933]